MLSLKANKPNEKMQGYQLHSLTDATCELFELIFT